MGGNAIKTVETRRLNKAEYEALRDEVVGIISRLRSEYLELCHKSEAPPNRYASRHVEEVASYRNKPDFGDLDLLVSEPLLLPPRPELSLREYIGIRLKDISQEVVHNTARRSSEEQTECGSDECFESRASTISFEYKNFQVDLIFTPEPLVEAAHLYYGYNDLGNLLGKIAKAQGLRYGHKGLYWEYRRGTQHIKDLYVTRDLEVIADMLGVDAEVWKKGFDTLEDIFEFVVNSKYFDTSIFQHENTNCVDRIRNRKRKVYEQFLQYIATEKVLSRKASFWDYGERYSEAKKAGQEATLAHMSYKRSEALSKLLTRFPKFKSEYLKATDDVYIRDTYKTRFNASIVRDVTGIADDDGQTLGEFMKFIKDDPESWPVRVLLKSNQSIIDWIEMTFAKWKSSKT